MSYTCYIGKAALRFVFVFERLCGCIILTVNKFFAICKETKMVKEMCENSLPGTRTCDVTIVRYRCGSTRLHK